MADHSPEAWERLGRAVKRARKAIPAYRDTQQWAAAVGRSSRVVLGLERGEPTGDETLMRIEQLLGWQPDRTWLILTDGAGADDVSVRTGPRPDLSTVPLDELLAEVARRAGAIQPPREES